MHMHHHRSAVTKWSFYIFKKDITIIAFLSVTVLKLYSLCNGLFCVVSCSMLQMYFIVHYTIQYVVNVHIENCAISFCQVRPEMSFRSIQLDRNQCSVFWTEDVEGM